MIKKDERMCVLLTIFANFTSGKSDKEKDHNHTALTENLSLIIFRTLDSCKR